MQEHNPSLIPIIVAEDSHKIERTNESRKHSTTRGSDGEGVGEVPMGLFRSGIFILHKPPKILITIAYMKTIKVKVCLHTLNELLRLPLNARAIVSSVRSASWQ